MTISVVTDLTATPPKNTISVSSGAGTVMSSVSLYRNDPSGKVLVRTQPSAGFASQTVTDVECPYGVTNSYSWSAVSATPAGAVWDEVWASVAAWTVVAGGWTVTSGKVKNNTGSSFGAELDRTIGSAGRYSVTISSLASLSGPGYVNFGNPASGAPTAFGLVVNGSVLSVYTHDVGRIYAVTTIDPSLPVTVNMNATSFTVSGTGGSVTVPYYSTSYSTINQVSLFTLNPTDQMQVGEIKVQSYGTSSTINETSSPVNVNSTDGWMIHPIIPAKSCRLGLSGHRVSTIRNLGDILNPSNATIHNVLGSATPISTVTGPRGDDQLEVIVSVTTTAEEAAIKAMLADQTPILFNLPPAKNIGLDYGFYFVGDTTRSRFGQMPNLPFKSYVMPLTKVQSPIASVIVSGWSWAALLLAFPDWNTIKLAFNTWADVKANNRNPGY